MLFLIMIIFVLVHLSSSEVIEKTCPDVKTSDFLPLSPYHHNYVWHCSQNNKDLKRILWISCDQYEFILPATNQSMVNQTIEFSGSCGGVESFYRIDESYVKNNQCLEGIETNFSIQQKDVITVHSGCWEDLRISTKWILLQTTPCGDNPWRNKCNQFLSLDSISGAEPRFSSSSSLLFYVSIGILVFAVQILAFVFDSE